MKKYVPLFVKRLIRNFAGAALFGREVYSQEGEDLVLARILAGRKNGFFVDVGAHHPFRFSNTYLFYKMGWRGINIDAMPGAMKPFYRFRSRDINIECGVSDVEAEMRFSCFNDPALNTFDSELAAARNGFNGHKIVEVITIKCVPLKDILDKYLPGDVKKIDFMSVDVEGADVNVLRSNDWDRYRPDVVAVELLRMPVADVLKSDAATFLNERGYIMTAKTANTVFFEQKKQPCFGDIWDHPDS